MFRTRAVFVRVTEKLAKRRQKWMEKEYPHYEPFKTEKSFPKRGHRGGWAQNPSKEVAKLDPSHSAHSELKDRVFREVDREFVDKILGQQQNLYESLEENLRLKEEVKIELPEPKKMWKDQISNLTEKLKHERESASTTRPRHETLDLNGENDFFTPTRLIQFWTQNYENLRYCTFSTTLAVASFSSPLEEYQKTRKSSSIFDMSFRQILEVTGEDAKLTADHFLTAPVSRMIPGDCQFTCILDSKGMILDLGFCCLLDESRLLLLLDGFRKTQIFNYLSQYLAYSQQSGLDSRIGELELTSFSIQGPESAEVLIASLEHLKYEIPKNEFKVEIIQDLPQFHSISVQRGEEKIFIFRGGIIGEDGYELLAKRQTAETLIQIMSTISSVAGILALDMLRMEAGYPRTGFDTTPLTSPVKAGLTWCLDQKKVRNHVMFGWRELFHQLAKGPSQRRIGIVVDGFAHANCQLYSVTRRQPVGKITSCAWSPALQKRVCSAYVSLDYARFGKKLLVSLLQNIQQTTKSSTKRLHRMGMFRNVRRRLVLATVVNFPIVSHKY